MSSTPTREATPDEAAWVLAHLPEVPRVDVTVHALTRQDGAAWFWVYPQQIALGELYVTWVVERTARGEASVGSFRSRRAAKGDVTVP